MHWFDSTNFIFRYQPGILNSSSQTEKLVELVGGERVAVCGDSGDEYGIELDDNPHKEKFYLKLLLVPSQDSPTEISGSIVYATTAVICKLFELFCKSSSL